MNLVEPNWALFARLGADPLRPQDEAFDLIDLVEGVVEQMEPKAHDKFVAFMAFVAPEIPPRLCGSPGYLQRALVNLIDNAIQLTEKGEVILRATLDRASETEVVARFEVSDTGMGLPDAVRQVATAAEDAPLPEGAPKPGVALAVTRRLARVMGGSMEIASTGSHGTTVTFTAPFRSTAPTALPAALAADDAGRPLRVLVVDDNLTHREILHRYLNYWGIRNAGAASGEQALAALRLAADAADPFQVAILDLAMPGMDGFALGHAIRREAALAGTRLILLTAFDERGQGEMAIREGFSAYLTKPVKHGHLHETIRSVLARRNGGGGMG